ncbi:hypothetical protein AK812_SmicGene1182 [Symbiodinium microadriaticum]|uniref:Uncharacterized protein n=1 Tax=Symbiodinium microadriaticum TaxID=2951 RepID=A0A1Q9F4L6_SYMMI|nr:hypothetical protein AK812_SmicGene1182 [Symbiodinium microadriaticum]
MDGWMDGWMDGCMDAWMYGWMDGWMDGCMDAWMYGSVDVWMHGWVDAWMYGCMDGCVGRWVGGRTDGQMDGWLRRPRAFARRNTEEPRLASVAPGSHVVETDVVFLHGGGFGEGKLCGYLLRRVCHGDTDAEGDADDAGTLSLPRLSVKALSGRSPQYSGVLDPRNYNGDYR